MLPHISANGIDLAKTVLSFATALITFAALLKKIQNPDIGFLKTLSSGKKWKNT